MRLIDADALTEIIHGMYAEGDDPSTYYVDAEGDTLIGKFAVVDAILNMPTIEQPQTAHWVQKPNIYGVAYCSRCDYELHTNDTNYCPNCGADMRGEQNEAD